MLKTTWVECRTCQMDYGFLGERESEEHVVIRERRHKMTWAMLVPRKGTEFPWIAKRAARFIDQLGHNRVTLRCDSEPPIEALAREIGQARQEGSQTVPERPPVGEGQSNGTIELAVGLVAGQAGILKAALEHRTGTRVLPDARTQCWLVEHAASLMNRCDIDSDGKMPLQRLHCRRDNTPVLEYGEKILYMPAKPARGGKWEPRFHPGVFVGMLNSSSEAVVVTEQEQRSRHARRTSGESPSQRDGTRTEHLEYELFHGLRMAVTMHSTFESEWRDPRRWYPETGELLMEKKVARTYLRRADFQQWDLSEGCPGFRYLRTGQERQQAHSQTCRRRIEVLWKGDPVGSMRLAAADERINRALADAVERHARILKRTSAVCHPESESHKKIAMDGEQPILQSHTKDHQRQAHDPASPQALT